MIEKQTINEKQTILVNFKLTTAEKQKLKKCAASENRCMTNWLRNKIITCYDEIMKKESE